MKNILQPLKTIILALLLAFSVSYVFAAWSGPTATPPDGNTDAPVNVGIVDQIKDAGLGVNALSVFGRGLFSGEVQIGSTGLICEEDVWGTIKYDDTSNCLQLCTDPDWQDVSCAAPDEYGWVYIGQESKLTGFGSCYQNVHHTITCDAVWDGMYMYGDRDSPYNPDRTDCPTCNYGHYGEVFGTAGPGIRVYVSTHTSHSYPYHDYNGIQGPNYGVTLPLYGLSWNEPNVISGGYDAVLSEDDKILETWKGDTCGSDGSQMTMVDIYECQVIN